ncbi:Protein kinase kin1 [Neolecta irregularis DAH-3]|uniref:non-specific serine/threonine protein kinase n=1 Tax=Neolecta irregularis (strain DAH-3) TaxID=1198029 RepID=A0A1U7LSC9_NEOID|nr:Protein kinase kin1 [Neolecta irregularis DAH-3]|eukprot:OLL25575.1 Protein kinase kin1 [Neolecta irregularis DAH-3]
MNLPPPSRNRQLGDWILGKTVGQGSMGKVKVAYHIHSGHQVAVKIVPRSPDSHRDIRIVREAAIVKLLNHPYICALRDILIHPSSYYLLFEYVDGGQMLDYIISHGKLKEKHARKFARQIVSALDYCHRNNIVHRDLKIENILISKAGNIKIIDFGLSNLFSPRSLLHTFCGSLYFAAPELLNAKPYVGPEIDIWSFGIVLYVLVCGKVPFDDQSMPALHAKIKKGLVEYPLWLTSDCKHLLSRLLVTDPSKRATMAEILLHPWITKGYDILLDNCIPQRSPLSLPLDQNIIAKMTGFDFGDEQTISLKLKELLESDEYIDCCKKEIITTEKRSRLVDFFARKHGTPPHTTCSGLPLINIHVDPVHSFHPLLSIYFLVKEFQERDGDVLKTPKTPPKARPRVSMEASSSVLVPFGHPDSSEPETKPGLLRRFSTKRWRAGLAEKPSIPDLVKPRKSLSKEPKFDSGLGRNTLDSGLGRSTSVARAEYYRRKNQQPQRKNISTVDRNANRAKSLGHAQNSSRPYDESSSSSPQDRVKPVFLKGLFSVATTSTKPPSEIHSNLIAVLKSLGVTYREIRGGFTCIHRPSIIPLSHPSSQEELFVSSSLEDVIASGGVSFEVYIVKIPLLALHGVQFKRVGGDTWQYKNMAARILEELKL